MIWWPILSRPDKVRLQACGKYYSPQLICVYPGPAPVFQIVERFISKSKLQAFIFTVWNIRKLIFRWSIRQTASLDFRKFESSPGFTFWSRGSSTFSPPKFGAHPEGWKSFPSIYTSISERNCLPWTSAFMWRLAWGRSPDLWFQSNQARQNSCRAPP